VNKNRTRAPQHEQRAYALARDVRNMMLAMAFMRAKSAGMSLYVHKIDGHTNSKINDPDQTRINVDVANGIIKVAWVG